MVEPTATGSHINSDQDIHLFNPQILTKLSSWGFISDGLEKNNLLARPLRLVDFENGYNQLMAKLSTAGNISKLESERRFQEMKAVNMTEDQYVIVILEDTIEKKVVGSATLLLELKFIHQCSVRGRLEDFVILDSHLSEEFGGLVIKMMIEIAREVYNCYKITLNCKEEQKRLFTNNGFTYGSNVLGIEFNVGQRPTVMASSMSDIYLFEPSKLTQLSKWAEINGSLEKNGLRARPLKLSDYENGYLHLLAQLTVVGSISKSEFETRFHEIRRLNQVRSLYEIVIIEDCVSGKVVGASTLFLELKFIDKCCIKGRLEDVAVLDTYRGKKIGEFVVKIIVELAKEAFDCSGLFLDCEDDLKRFYAKNGFIDDSDMLKIKFYD